MFEDMRYERMHIIKPVIICINFRVYIGGKWKYFMPISTPTKRKEIKNIAKIEVYQSKIGIELKVFTTELTKRQYL